MTYAHAWKLPYPPLLLRVLGAGAGYWLLTRLAYVMMLFVGHVFFGWPRYLEDAISAALHPAPLSRVLLIGMAASFVWLERRRSHEPLLQANFGVWTLWFWLTAVVSASMMDIGAQTVLRAF